MTATVYHGSLQVVRTPVLAASAHIGDFGRGFYVTTSREQALRFTGTKCRREGRSAGWVSSYALDEGRLARECRVLAFDGPTRAWAEFVMANRRDTAFSHDWDVVRGPVADDQVYAAFSLFEMGVIDFEALVEKLRVRRLSDQLLFHSAAALGCLAFLSGEEVACPAR